MEERSVSLDIEPSEEPTTDDTVFYNPDMVTNRDITIAALQAFRANREKDITVCDALSGSGVRGLRTLNEVDGVAEVVLNDTSPAAVERITEAVEAHGVAERARVTQRDAAALLSDNVRQFDVVDIDPFGSPAPFLDAAARATRHEGLAAFTATDLGPLYGSYPEVCRRRYAARPLKTEFGHETGLRILMKEVFHAFSRYDHVFEPVLAWHEQHYSRVIGIVRESKKGCNRSLDHIKFLGFCPACRWRGYQDVPVAETCPHCGGDVWHAGPLWSGKLGRRDVAEQVVEWCADAGWEEAAALVGTLTAELPVETPFYDTHELASAADVPAPRRADLLERLRAQGYTAVETHFAPHGIRTDAPIATIHDALRD